MINLVKLKKEKGIIGKKLLPGEASYKYVEQKLFLALKEQPFFCCKCGGGQVDPNDYESIDDIHICPICRDGYDKFGFAYWNPALKEDFNLDVCLNAEPETICLMLVILNDVAQKHNVKITYYVKKDESYISVI